MTDILISIILIIIVGGAILYIYKAKKSGTTCIGCSHGKDCTHCKEKKEE